MTIVAGLSPRARRVALAALTIVATLMVVVALLAVVALRALEAKDGEWSMRLGPSQRAVNVPVLLRWASHPLALPLLDGRSLRTRAGTWRIATGEDALRATCAPCVLRLAELGPAPLVIDRVVVHARRAGPEAWAGTVVLGVGHADAAAATITWQAKLQRDALAWQARLAPTPVAALLATLGDAVPEARHARIDGRFAFDVSARIDHRGIGALKVAPRLEGLFVDGLGTQALHGAQIPARCLPTRERIDGWLPRAVVAAEDQRFFEHAGFDIGETVHAWTRNRDGGAVVGASTITQQLAKLVYTGDDRSAARKLREWLYAVEMERTLGKGRILQLYLALAPWGADVCGAEAASRRWLGKPAHRLAPHEAAWLASLLVGPDAQLARWHATGVVDHDRVARVIDAYRPMPKSQRVQHLDVLVGWQPVVRELEGRAAP